MFNALFAAALQAAAASTCSDYVGRTVNPTPFVNVASSLRNMKPKDEFETTEAYARRTTAASSDVIIAKPVEPWHVKYDADAGKLLVMEAAFSQNSLLDYGRFFIAADLDIATGLYNRNIAANISESETIAGHYRGQNSFGATATVEKSIRNEFAIFDSAPDGLQLNPYATMFGSTDDHGVTISISANVNEAKILKHSFRAAFVIAPRSPFLVRARYRLSGATIQDPADTYIDGTVILANMQCGLLLNSGGKVLWSEAIKKRWLKADD